MIGIDLNTRQVLNAVPKAIQKINFTGNLARAKCARMIFFIVEAQETILNFSRGTVKVL